MRGLPRMGHCREGFVWGKPHTYGMSISRVGLNPRGA